MKRMGVGVIGAGNISTEYLRALNSYAEIEVMGIADLDQTRARAQADAFGIAHSGSTRDILDMPDVELIVNLTIPAVHAEVALQAIVSGKHVWGEKPFALDLKSAQRVLEAAEEHGVAVGNAPDTVLGHGIQNSLRLLRDGRIGEPRSVLTLMQGPGPDAWHPRPEFFFQAGAGPLFDIGPYYVTAMVMLFGGVEEVQAQGNRAFDERSIPYGPRQGEKIPVDVPTHLGVLAKFQSGVLGTSVYSFDSSIRRQLFEVTGTQGVLTVPVSGFDGDSTVVPAHLEDPQVLQVSPDHSGRLRGVGVLEMARAIRAGREPRASGRLAFHVLEVMLAIEQSAVTGQPVRIDSTIAPIAGMQDDWDAQPTA